MRSVPEWIARHDDQAIPRSVKRRIIVRQGNVCAISGRPFTAKDRPQYDHIKPLWLGGEHREDNIHAILDVVHARKTQEEAPVRAKVYRQKDKHLGLKEKKPWNAQFRKKLDGTVVKK